MMDTNMNDGRKNQRAENDLESLEEQRVPRKESLNDIHSDDSDSDISRTSFKRWHRHLQTEHMRSKRSSFTTWKCCYRICRPCRWFDSIDYETNICKVCLKFRTFKTLGTILLVGCFTYILAYALFGDDVLPEGTIFFLLVLFITGYLAGYSLMQIGLPPMLGHFAVGIIFEFIPEDVFPRENHELIEYVSLNSEQILLIIALIRAGLLLDLSRIKRHVFFIIRLSLLPFLVEFLIVWTVTHFLFRLPWEWAAVQGSVMSVVSLASVTSIMHKNKYHGYGEDKDLCTVLVAASVLNVIFGIFFYIVSLTYALPEGGRSQGFSQILLLLIKQFLLGMSVGGVSGLLVAFFPDKRNTEAAAIRILLIGIGSFAIALLFISLNMIGAAVLGSLTLCVTAANMWEELGWHKDNNPVQYFYTMAYYFSQPVVLSVLGYTMDFQHSEKTDIGKAIVVLIAGLMGREVITITTTASSKSYVTNTREKIFISIAWFSKGTFQLLLASAIYIVFRAEEKYFDQVTYDLYLQYTTILRTTTVVAILLTTPLAYFALTFLTPKLLKKPEQALEMSAHSQRRRTSIKYLAKYTPGE